VFGQNSISEFIQSDKIVVSRIAFCYHRLKKLNLKFGISPVSCSTILPPQPYEPMIEANPMNRSLSTAFYITQTFFCLSIFASQASSPKV